MLNEIQGETRSNMDKGIDALKKQLAVIRTGRANATMLDGVRVDYYGTPTPLGQVSTVTTPDARLILIKPWEKGMLKEIEKAIVDSNVGLTPTNDGDFIRVPIPPLSEERRREYVKQAKNRCEDAKVAIRNARRDANEMLKEATKEGEISEDEEKRGLKVVQDLTDEYVKKVDELLSKKEAEIMEV